MGGGKIWWLEITIMIKKNNILYKNKYFLCITVIFLIFTICIVEISGIEPLKL